MYYGSDHRSRDPAYLEIDRAWKGYWHEEADHKFFNNDVIKVHWAGAFGTSFDSKARAGGKYPKALILPHLQGWPFGKKRNKDEISTIGYYKSNPSQTDRIGVYGLIIGGWVSYASSKDAETEWTSKAGESDIKKHKQSGLPKRPANQVNAMYGKQDFVEPIETHNELIVDNWSIRGVILDFEHRYWGCLGGCGNSEERRKVKESKNLELQQIVKFTRDLGIPLFDQSMKRIN